MPRREEYQRAKAANPEKVKAERRASYQRHREAELARMARWLVENRARKYELNRQARERNPDSYLRANLLSAAKRLIGLQCGINRKLVSREVAEVKMIELAIQRILKGK